MIDTTETTRMAQVEAINTRRNEVDKKVEAEKRQFVTFSYSFDE